MTPRNKTTVAIAIGLAAAALLVVFVRPPSHEVQYLTERLEMGRLVSTIKATGTVKPVGEVKVGSQISGQIAELLADFNDGVEQGVALARLDPETFEAELRAAEADLRVAQAAVMTAEAAIEQETANLANATAQRAVLEARVDSVDAVYQQARRNMERLSKTASRGSATVSQVENARAEQDTAAADLRAAQAQLAVQDAAIASAQAAVKMARSRLENARAAMEQKQAITDRAHANLERTVIRAPISGVVIGRDVDRGQTVAATLEAPTLFTLAQDLHLMELHASIDEADIGKVTVGQRVTFGVDSFPKKSFGGQVLQIRKSPKVTQNVVTYTVLVSAENPELLLLPGMTAALQVVVEESQDVLKIPNAALRFQPPGKTQEHPSSPTPAAGAKGMPALAWVPDGDGQPQPVSIRVGASDASGTEVLAGPLAAGDEVLVGHVAEPPRSSWLGLRLGF